MRGRLIALEGGEACGKSTQAARLATAIGAVLTREPGGTRSGEQIRALLLDEAGPSLVPRAEALLMAAARAQHVAEVIRPALEAGRDVVTDRYAHSSLAYQGHGRRLPVSEVAQLSTWATEDLWPDLVILLDLPGDVASQRRGASADRFESEGEEFHRRVRQGYRQLASEDPLRWRVIDGSGTVEEVAAQVLRLVGP